jgi:hypothetical protein
MARKKISEHFVPFVEAKEALDKKIKAEGETAMKAFFKDYFEAHPEVYGVKWEQFVPYFNDGSACEFSLHGVYTFKTKDAFESEDSMYDNDGAEECYNDEPYDSLEKVEDILETVFGEHARVAVTRDSITTEEFCDHD